MATNINAELGAGVRLAHTADDDAAAFDALIDRVREFNPDDADLDDVKRIAKACKLIADDTIRLHGEARAMAAEAQRRVKLAEVNEAVLDVVNPVRRAQESRRGLGFLRRIVRA